MLQIIARGGTILWDDIELPEGRTKKACVVMIDKEKTKIKKAREAAGEVIEVRAPIYAHLAEIFAYINNCRTRRKAKGSARRTAMSTQTPQLAVRRRQRGVISRPNQRRRRQRMVQTERRALLRLSRRVMSLNRQRLC